MSEGQSKKKNAKLPRAIGSSFSNFFKSLFLILLLMGIAGFAVGSFIMLRVIESAPNLEVSRINPTNSTLIFDMDGELVDERGAVRREWVDFQDISPVMVDAIVATEDGSFFTHSGVDWRRTIAANLQNLGTWFGDSSSIQGGSTITQQLVKMSHLTPENGAAEREGIEGIQRKIQEIYLAMQLEQIWTKEQILTAYLNFSPFGGNLNGIQRASEFYFGTDASNLTLSEAAALAGMVQAPNTWRPDHNPDNTERRRDVVLELMVRHGYITPEMATLARAEPVTDNLVYTVTELDSRHQYQAYIDAVLEEVQERFGLDASMNGLQIFTNMDRNAQAFIHTLQNTNEIVNWPNDNMQNGISFIETMTGRVRAIGGGRNQAVGERLWNRATQTRRQIGSTAKSPFVYAPGMEKLGWGTGTSFNDDLWAWPGQNILRNWDLTYHGVLTIRQALDMSYNVPAGKGMIQLLDQIGQEGMQEWVANMMGLSPEEVGTINPSAAIGTMEFSPMQMAAAYAAFGNGGTYNEPFFIDRVILPDGTVIYGEDIRESHQAMSAETAWMTTETLRSVMTQGTGATWANQGIGHMNLAGKTGTTNFDDRTRTELGIGAQVAMPDTWFVGFSGEFTAAVWSGFDSNRDKFGQPQFIENHTQGISGQVFNQIMRNLNTGTQQLPRPETVQGFTIELESGGDGNVLLASTNTPQSYRATEFFRVGTQPVTASTRFTQLDTPQNFRGSQSGTSLNFEWDHIPAATALSRDALVSAISTANAVGRNASSLSDPAVLRLAIQEGQGRMMLRQLDTIGATIYTVFAETTDGSTFEIGRSFANSLTATVSLGELARIKDFYVIASFENWGGLDSTPSNRFQVAIDPTQLMVQIPNMRGWTTDQATEWADQNGINLNFAQESSVEVEAGLIVYTDPAGEIQLGGTLRVAVSSGPAFVPQPPTEPETPEVPEGETPPDTGGEGDGD
ncbi:MAG: transglycosylase domain-containing protein [Turicibacter sp.]|nr:transglycosylase domain-containing protein [Turicibacter sp.]